MYPRKKLSPPLKWHGGKHYLAQKIIALMPPHRHYVEPFAGGLSVLLAKDPFGVSEVVNDLDGRLTNFWRILQRKTTFEKFQRIVEAIPFSETEWREARCWTAELGPDREVHEAVAFFVECRMSLAGRMETFAPLSRRRTRRGMNEQASAWLNAVKGLRAVHRRLRRVAILNRPALELIRGQDGPNTLFYLDPPYLPSTRSAPDVYEHEMSEADHRELLTAIQDVQGLVMISGYPSPLYDSLLAGWERHAFDLPNHASGTKNKKREQEILWCNFATDEENLSGRTDPTHEHEHNEDIRNWAEVCSSRVKQTNSLDQFGEPSPCHPQRDLFSAQAMDYP